MGESIKLGRIAGFPVSMHWSVLIIGWLLAWALASGLLPDAAPGLSSGTYWWVAAAGALLLFASLLAHELGHALVARRAGVEVKGVNLWLFGGVAHLEGEARTPGAELRIAAVGPAVSLAAAAGFGLAAAGASATGAPDVVAALFGWLAVTNLVLAAFNLIPGAPLDGGRILRAYLWRRHGDRLRATRTAARAGRFVGFGLIGFGLAEFFFGADLGGLWTVFVGWFLLGAAKAEETSAVAQDLLGDLRVREVMTPEPETAPSWRTLDVFVDELAARSRHSAFPVEDFDGRPVGLVTLAHVRRVPAERWGATRVADVALPLARVPRAHPDERLTEMLERALVESLATGGRYLVVDDDGRLAGVVTRTDLARVMERRALLRPADAAADRAPTAPPA